MKKGNTPYVKKYENGILVNPITKENPYSQNPSDKGGKKLRRSHNGKSYPLTVVRIGKLSFAKYFNFRQTIGKKLIVHSILK